MIHLIPTTTEQTIKVLPREYTDSIVLFLRDDSTNNQVQIVFPTTVTNGNYLDITNVFTLSEGRFYDLTIYKAGGDYNTFKERVIADSGTFENNTCLYNDLDANGLIGLGELDVIYKDKIFATDQDLNQNTNTYYTPNEVITQSANNDFIIYD